MNIAKATISTTVKQKSPSRLINTVPLMSKDVSVLGISVQRNEVLELRKNIDRIIIQWQ